ncbi:MAG: hypothetical protein IPO64_15090 [Bacteroidetes bacterium]|nr:hypothetical protein [Bacteroidota bacterium]
MSNYNLENVKFYPCKVLFKDEIVEYFYMHILDLNFVDCNKVIDFNNSFIYDKKIDKYFTFKNIEGIKEFFSIIRTYNVTKVFKLKYIPKELFKLPFRIEILVKREIKEEIKKQKFSGIEFEEIENLTLQ